MLQRLFPLIVLCALWCASSAAFARNCAITVEATDMMTFNLKTLRVPGDCTQLRVTLKHVGRMPAQAMGHNWVLTETRHHRDMGLAGGRMKLADDYLPRNDARVIAHTLPHLVSSIGVLEKNDFRLTGPGAEAGTVRYELARTDWRRR